MSYATRRRNRALRAVEAASNTSNKEILRRAVGIKLAVAVGLLATHLLPDTYAVLIGAAVNQLWLWRT